MTPAPMSSLNPNTPSPVFLKLPMPVQGTDHAPFFNERGVCHFLCVLIDLEGNVGILDHNELVLYILRYSSEEVKEVIHHMPEFDEDIPGKEWTQASEMLILLYVSIDDSA